MPKTTTSSTKPGQTPKTKTATKPSQKEVFKTPKNKPLLQVFLYFTLVTQIGTLPYDILLGNQRPPFLKKKKQLKGVDIFFYEIQIGRKILLPPPLVWLHNLRNKGESWEFLVLAKQNTENRQTMCRYL